MVARMHEGNGNRGRVESSWQNDYYPISNMATCLEAAEVIWLLVTILSQNLGFCFGSKPKY